MGINDAPAASTAITIGDAGTTDARGKAPAAATATVVPATPFATFLRKINLPRWKRGVACFDFLLRLLAVGATLSATAAMASAEETLPFVTEHFQFHASYSNFPSLTFFVIGNAIALGYLVISLPFSIVAIVRLHAVWPRQLLIVFDTVMVALITAAASSAAAIVYLAHEGNSSANWVAICMRFQDFCQQTSGAVEASFVAVLFLMLLVMMSALVQG